MRAAFYECDVTPPLGGFLWGHYKEAYAMDVHTRLYAKAVVVEDEGEYAALLVIDSCALPHEIHDIVTKRVYEYTGITADKICVSANHTHSGAPVFDSPEIGCYADATYKDVFFRRCADAIILAYNRLDDVKVSFSTTEVTGPCFNRNYLRQNGTYGTQPAPTSVRPLDGVDEELPALMFEQNGQPIGAIISYALHQCLTNEANRGYSGDYAAILSEKLKEKYGDDFVSLFLVGTCGDVNHLNPNPGIERFNYKTLGPLLAESFVKSQENRVDVPGGVGAIKEYINVPRRSADPQLARDRMTDLMANDKSLMRVRNMLYYVSKEQPESTDLAVQCIKIGDTLIACLPGEIYVAYGKRIKEQSPFKHTMVIENCNTYCGYIPTYEVFDKEKDNLYETSLCYHSCHIPEAGNMITDKALELSKKLK
jgi:hypothetical protein